MADSIPKFHDAAERAPVGGWHYFYNPSDGNTAFKLGSADEVIDELVKFRTNNRTFTSREDIEREVWRYYCSRHPDRCAQPIPAEGVVPYLPLDQQPEFFGPIIWRFLNLAATRYEFTGRDFFMSLVQHTVNVISCPNCREEYIQLITEHPPTTISSTRQACEWVNMIHNFVNEKLDKQFYPYARMVTEYGAPI